MNYSLILVIGFLFLLTDCSKPIDESKKDYVGYWKSYDMELIIRQNGKVSYKRTDGNVTTSVNAPLKAFTDDGFVVGVAFFTTTFKVTEKPHKVNSYWQMVVDGARLTRIKK